MSYSAPYFQVVIILDWHQGSFPVNNSLNLVVPESKFCSSTVRTITDFLSFPSITEWKFLPPFSLPSNKFQLIWNYFVLTVSQSEIQNGLPCASCSLRGKGWRRKPGSLDQRSCLYLCGISENVQPEIPVLQEMGTSNHWRLRTGSTAPRQGLVQGLWHRKESISVETSADRALPSKIKRGRIKLMR